MEILLNYKECLETIDIYTKMLLFEIATKEKSHKDIYLRNSIAKANSLLNSIFILYDKKAYYDGWILFRALIDRLVHIYYLADTDSFEVFDKWTFIKKYEYWNSAKSDDLVKQKTNGHPLSPKKEDSIRYNKFKSENIRWERPNAETILKSRNLTFLYKFGYNYASARTHPLSDDGEFEFYSITRLEPNPYNDINNEELIKNSILIYSLIINETLNISNLRFSKVLYDFVFSIRKFLEENSENYKDDMSKIVLYKMNGLSFCE